MPHVLIHTFEPHGRPFFDDEGDQLIGSYYQFLGPNDVPLSEPIGPYRDIIAAEQAAMRAYKRRDFC